MSDPHLIIAIDGPAASGKSTVSKRVAKALGAVFVSSGEMYRAFTWLVLEKGLDPNEESDVIALLQETDFTCGECEGVGTISIDGRLLGRSEFSDDRVNGAVSLVAKIPVVREQLVAAQRAYADRFSVVMEGRDIGSVVFPETPHKFYIDASPEVRAARRRAEGITDSVAERDKIDSSRKASPLVIPDDALVIDSSHLSAEEVTEKVLESLPK